MVWEEILIGFTVAGFMAVLVPPSFWSAIFLQNATSLPEAVVVVENALVAPFVAAATFIGSMGNIPLATVLNANGVLFAGILGFIYSDLMVPPLVMVNARYYGWRAALYIAAVMFVSIVITALVTHYSFGALGWTPDSDKRVADVTAFAIDYTFYLNVAAALLAGGLLWLARSGERDGAGHHHHGGSAGTKRYVALSAALLLTGGLVSLALTAS
jgi:hypothetical protein